jgi:hypothetical protein
MSEEKLADRIRDAIRLRGYSIRTEKAYVQWYERFVRFHKLRHPSTMGAPEIEQFLSHLASQEQVAASTQNQALSALLFLYRGVLRLPLDDLDIMRARRTTYVQPYLSHDECLRILAQLDPVPYLVACLLYGGGLRLLEAAQRLALPAAGRDLDSLPKRDSLNATLAGESLLSALRWVGPLFIRRYHICELGENVVYPLRILRFYCSLGERAIG